MWLPYDTATELTWKDVAAGGASLLAHPEEHAWPAEKVESLNLNGRFGRTPGGPYFLSDAHRGFVQLYRDKQVGLTVPCSPLLARSPTPVRRLRRGEATERRGAQAEVMKQRHPDWLIRLGVRPCGDFSRSFQSHEMQP